MRNRRGYTLLELITALCICFVLIGLVVAGISATRAAANTQSCAHSLRQLSTAMLLYVSDYDGTFPTPFQGTFITTDNSRPVAHGGNVWSVSLNTYIHSSSTRMFPHCPLVDLDRLPDAIDNERLCGYAFNDNISEARIVSTDKAVGKDELVGVTESSIGSTSLTFLLAEARLGVFSLHKPDIKQLGRVPGMIVVELRAFIHEQPPGATRHQGGANYAFTDGHVKWFKPNQLTINDKSDGRQPGFGL